MALLDLQGMEVDVRGRGGLDAASTFSTCCNGPLPHSNLSLCLCT